MCIAIEKMTRITFYAENGYIYKITKFDICNATITSRICL